MLKALILFFGFSFAAHAADDGFIWIDANTRIKVKPAPSAAGGASAPEKKAPESSKKVPKKEQPKKE
jgi:hypothetical protein